MITFQILILIIGIIGIPTILFYLVGLICDESWW